MKLTLLSVTQSYLNRTSGFYVNSIFETDESQQVAQIAEEVYYSLIQKLPNLQFTTALGQLESVADTTKPNYLRIPDNVSRIQESTIEYNFTDFDKGISTQYRPVKYLHPTEFLALLKGRSSTNANVQEVKDFNETVLLILNDKHPEYCTSFDGEYLVFDSYVAEKETTLHNENSRVLFNQEATFLQQDDFVIPVPEHYSELYRDLVLIEVYSALRGEDAPMNVQRRAASRLAAMQQMERKVGSMHNPKTRYGRR